MVLAEFDNRTPVSTLGSTVTELFRIGLIQSAVVRVLEPRQLTVVLTRMQWPPDTRLDPDVAMEVAEREGLSAIVTGEILSVGSGEPPGRQAARAPASRRRGSPLCPGWLA